MINIHIEDDDIYSLGLSNNMYVGVFKEERRWVCKTTHLDGKQRVLGRETALLSLCKTNCLFLISVQLYLIGNLFLLSLFPLLFLFLLLKFFPLGKLNNFPRISIANNLRALRVDNIIILIKARTLFENIISNIPQIQLGKKTEKRKKKKKKKKKTP